MRPAYDLDKIKFATDRPTFERAVGLLEAGKVKDFKEQMSRYSAVVQGTKPYKVFVSSRHYDEGACECYLGQEDTLCKHMVAVALYAVKGGEALSDDDKKLTHESVCSGRLGELTKDELMAVKAGISAAMRYIKPYDGPSRIWFAYQNSLQEGCNRLSRIISDLPVGEQSAKIIIDLLLKLDKKLSTGGVDDSDGTVGGFMEEAVSVLQEFVRRDQACARPFARLRGRETCFGWEAPLLALAK